MRYVSRHEFCRAMHGRLPLLSASRLPIKCDAPELWSMIVGSRSCLSPVIAIVLPLDFGVSVAD
jgi:hypothetical protein